MKMFSGFIVAAIVLATLPHLNAAPNLDALLKHIAALHGSEDQPSSPYGISTIGCPQDMLELNPVMNGLQMYGNEFGMVVECSKLCTDLTIYGTLSGQTFHSTVCSESTSSQGMKLYVIGKVCLNSV